MRINREIKFFDYYGFDGTLSRDVHQSDFISYFYNFNGCFFILCDSNKLDRSAAKASQIVISNLQNFLNKKIFDDPLFAIKKALQYANQRLYFAKQRDETLFDTDIQCLVVSKSENQLFYASVGDINLFYFKGTDIISLNSFALLTELEKKAKKSHKKQLDEFEELSNTLGENDNVRIVSCLQPVVPLENDGILLCPKEFTLFLDKDLINGIYLPSDSDHTRFIHELEYYYINRNTKPIKFQFVKFKFSPATSTPSRWEMIFNKAYIYWYRIYNWKYFLHSVVILIVFSLFFIIFFNINVEEEPESKPIVSVDSIEVKSVDSLMSGNKLDSVKIEVIHKSQINRPVNFPDTILYFRVRRGDDLKEISLMFNNDMKIISLENNLSDQKVTAGQILKVHIRALHKIAKGDNLEVISAYYNVAVVEILEANEMLDDIELKPGMQIIIPLP
jgi:LysM repeat protein/serine/threonine protein phosphatase PrpC